MKGKNSKIILIGIIALIVVVIIGVVIGVFINKYDNEEQGNNPSGNTPGEDLYADTTPKKTLSEILGEITSRYTVPEHNQLDKEGVISEYSIDSKDITEAVGLTSKSDNVAFDVVIVKAESNTLRDNIYIKFQDRLDSLKANIGSTAAKTGIVKTYGDYVVLMVADSISDIETEVHYWFTKTDISIEG